MIIYRVEGLRLKKLLIGGVMRQCQSNH